MKQDDPRSNASAWTEGNQRGALQPLADILKLAMVKLGPDDAAPGARMVLTVHDELVFEVPEGKATEEGERIRGLMAGAMKLAVPLVVDVGVGKNWADAH